MEVLEISHIPLCEVLPMQKWLPQEMDDVLSVPTKLTALPQFMGETDHTNDNQRVYACYTVRE